jgi:zinc transport system substrate-binding protein
MKKIIAALFLLAAVITGIVFMLKQTAADKTDTSKLSVVASYYPLFDFARQVGGDKVRVTNITPPGIEPHDYEPPAKTLANAQKTDVFIYNGAAMEPWAEGFVGDYEQTVVKAGSGIALATDEADSHDKGAKDPHFWLDPMLAQKAVANISDGLSKADPANKAYYAKNAEAYQAKLTKLDEEFRRGLRACEQNTIVTSHAAFSYVAKRYGFTMEAIAGLSPEEEPSAARLAELSDHVAQEGIEYVFFESLVSPQLADTIAQETGAQILVLDPIEGLSHEDQKQGKEYVSIQRENLANLRTALACK